MRVLKARAAIVEEQPERRFVLAPLYAPDRYDAHNEWSDSDELQKSLWGFMRGSRELRLQHSSHVIGDATEGVSWPFPQTVELRLPNGPVAKMTLPEGTVYLGGVIRPWAWGLYRSGKIRGWSLGGTARRIDVDLEPGIAKVLPTSLPNSNGYVGPNPTKVVQATAAKLGLGIPEATENRFVFTSPTRRYPADVEAAAEEMAKHFTLLSRDGGTSTWWHPGGTFLIEHHTPSSHLAAVQRGGA